ncbi:CAF17-like 4Fe-4S cluster assembly/insertion protein YgfZ [Leptolyngbya ohadii]|uniref:CAF17-like 4Fe-4S cluster assembly/insertion protein YgfZ n=1 Tax=Leptolyngbya ohadii TaxID=1962290 RepID=UPI000B59B1B4|nr:folate-binding protein YgfZ [Leptolyngbya ohadii]
MTQLHDLQQAAGAMLTASGEVKIPTSFGNDVQALQAAQSTVALYDRSHWGKIWVTGDDRLRFLHNQTTNNFQLLKPGQGCDTVFVTSTARTIDLATAYALPDGVLLLTSPGYSEKLIAWMDRYIFFADKVELKDVTASKAAFSLIGPESHSILERLGVGEIIHQPSGNHLQLEIAGQTAQIAVGSGLALPGYTLVTDTDRAGSLWQALTEAGAIPMGEQVWQQLRILQGRPVPDRELTDDYNPLEAGLWQTISLSKGCYIGQETIARLHTYKGVKQQLWGVQLDCSVEPETPVTLGDEKIGKLTSCTPTETGFFGLVYIRTKAVAPDLAVQVGDAQGKLVALPFISHTYL